MGAGVGMGLWAFALLAAQTFQMKLMLITCVRLLSRLSS